MMLSEKEIVEFSTSEIGLNKLMCVYFLIFNKKIIYIGSSKVLLNRLSAHYTNDKINFDSFHSICFNNLKDMRANEVLYINKFKPIHNIQHNSDARRMVKGKISKEKDLTKHVTISQNKADRIKADEIGIHFGIVNSNGKPLLSTVISKAINDLWDRINMMNKLNESIKKAKPNMDKINNVDDLYE